MPGGGAAIAIGIGAGWYDLWGKLLWPTIPLPDGDRMVIIETHHALRNKPEPRVTRDFLEWRSHVRSIDVGGIVRDGSPFPTGLNTGTVTILDGGQAGTSVSIQRGGAYTIRDLPSGTIRLSASSTGYRTAEQTVVVDGDGRADFSLPRISRSPIPPIAGTWTGLFRRDFNLRGVVEVTFVQSGMSLTATWRAPTFGDHGSFSGTIDNERTLRGRLRVDDTCTASGDLSGWIDYDEQLLLFGARVSDCGLPQVYGFEIRRR